jgi:hypothetical protein
MFTPYKKPQVVVYVRHRDECPNAFSKEINPRTGQRKKDEFYPLRQVAPVHGERQSSQTSRWDANMGNCGEKAQELQKQIDSGHYGKIAPTAVSNETTLPVPSIL